MSTTDVAPELAAGTLDLIDAGPGVGDEEAACIGPDVLATARLADLDAALSVVDFKIAMYGGALA